MSCVTRRKNSLRSARFAPRGSEPAGALRAPSLRSRKFAARCASQKIKQEYDSGTESTFIDVDKLSDKKSIYVTIVGGLIVVAFVAPMLQFFYYTGGE